MTFKNIYLILYLFLERREGETSMCETSIGGDQLPLTHPQLGTLSLTQLVP